MSVIPAQMSVIPAQMSVIPAQAGIQCADVARRRLECPGFPPARE
jgi:hypothetical protein